MTEPEEFNDAIEWIDVNFEPDDFNTFGDYLQAIRNEFQNENLISAIHDDIQDLFVGKEPDEREEPDEPEEPDEIEVAIESFMTRVFG